MNTIRITRHHEILRSNSSRVIIRPFVPADPQRMATIIGRALALPETEIDAELDIVRSRFQTRHRDFDAQLRNVYAKVEPHVFTQRQISSNRMLLIGSLFSGEYSIEAAALFNPSIVPHPDQSGVHDGGLRFIMSLRATGEGHISSIEFRTGLIHSGGGIESDPVSPFATVPEEKSDPSYKKKRFLIKLHEMNFAEENISAVMASLPESFTRGELNRSVEFARHEHLTGRRGLHRTLDFIQWLADSNYEICFGTDTELSERTIFPVSINESHGIEDARFVRFTEPDGTVMYYATYTAYNGKSTLPQLIETEDFRQFRVLTLNGCAVRNKGMALFPRKIGDKYVMLSRQDDENLLIMFSPSPHYWSTPKVLLRPAQIWEAVKLGNCGSPVETEAGWLVITHGVGPLRRYCIGAVLLDLENPSRVIGRLREPLLEPGNSERDGYVPNVVYSCGSLVHGRQLILPYAINDHSSLIASVSLDDLLQKLLDSPPFSNGSRLAR
jgi:predicted GH43/DUF377 family glycosyl hydrolase